MDKYFCTRTLSMPKSKFHTHGWSSMKKKKKKVNSVFLRDSTALSDSVVLLFGGRISRGGLDGHLKMLGGYWEFFMNPVLADTYLRLKKELDELIQMKFSNPKLDLQIHYKLLTAIRLLVSEDQCEGRFVFNRQQPSNSLTKEILKGTQQSKASKGGGDDISKNHLQTLLATYKAKPLKNNRFRSVVSFKGLESLDFVGQPCNNKKLAEKDAASQALQWLMGESQSSERAVDHMSLLLKNSKKKHQVHETNWR